MITLKSFCFFKLPIKRIRTNSLHSFEHETNLNHEKKRIPNF